MPASGVHHVDLAVADVERSLAFYRELLGPLGWAEEIRYPTYRGTEDVVYLVRDDVRNGGVGLRPADGATRWRWLIPGSLTFIPRPVLPASSCRTARVPGHFRSGGYVGQAACGGP